MNRNQTIAGRYVLYRCIMSISTIFAVCSCASRGLPSSYDEFSADHKFKKMVLYGSGERGSTSTWAGSRSVKSRKDFASFKIVSKDYAYISDILAMMLNSESIDKCQIEENVRWVIELRSGARSDILLSDGKVIIGPNDFCRSARGFENVDVFEMIEDKLYPDRYESAVGTGKSEVRHPNWRPRVYPCAPETGGDDKVHCNGDDMGKKDGEADRTDSEPKHKD